MNGWAGGSGGGGGVSCLNKEPGCEWGGLVVVVVGGEVLS